MRGTRIMLDVALLKSNRRMGQVYRYYENTSKCFARNRAGSLSQDVCNNSQEGLHDEIQRILVHGLFSLFWEKARNGSEYETKD